MFIGNKFEGWNAKKRNWKVEGKLVYSHKSVWERGTNCVF
jgi:hypothetical protein